MASDAATATATVSILCPTLGRSSLGTIVQQADIQLGPHDELIVVGDGPRPAARTQMEPFVTDPRFQYLEFPPDAPTGHYGSEQVDHAITHARGNYLMFIGDDDELAPEAISTFRKVCTPIDPHPYLFAMSYAGEIMRRNLHCGGCSGQQFVVPNDPARLARYSDSGGQTNDWHFMSRTLELWGGRIEIRDEILTILRGRHHGAIW